jgi:transcription initiation factor IIE alpha subunit
MTTCPNCHGRRTITETVAETRIGVTHPNGWHMPPVKVQYETGRTVDRLFTCPQCQGTGHDLAAIWQRTAADTLTQSDRAADEQRRIDAEKAEWEATRPDYAANSYANISADREPW